MHSCDAAYIVHCGIDASYIWQVIPAVKPEKGRKMFSLIRYLQAWKQYGVAVRELSNLNDRELADIGITRSDIPQVAWDHARR